MLVSVSQRRRRRINEKMKALQKLIPNANKVMLKSTVYNIVCGWFCARTSILRSCLLLLQTDKASMLDEAIEYLKQLQLQVQVSSFVFFWLTSRVSSEQLVSCVTVIPSSC